MDEREKAIRIRLRDDFPHYAAKALKVRAKAAGADGKIVPLVLNRAQLYIHQRLEDQRARTGKVRALILKGRQQGCSTYIGGRYYHITTHCKGIKTFILTHRDDATNNLFSMVRRFHEHCPELVKAHTSYSNRRELVFDQLDSAYSLGTAGSGDVGRSDTIDLFHGSEAAFWSNTDEIRSGALQAAGAAREIVFESTGNGFDPFFHALWQASQTGNSEYQTIFVPWFWQAEYAAAPQDGFSASAEERELAEAHGLTDAQLYWRRLQITALGGERLFRQEYPCTAEEAFQTSGDDSLIPVQLVTSAIGRNVGYHGAGLVMGLDVGMSLGGDPSAIVIRQGGNVTHAEEFKSDDTLVIAGKARERWEACPRKPEAIYVDSVGWGAGVAHTLAGWGLPVVAVNVAESASSSERFNRRRDELWWRAREFFAGKNVGIKESLELCHKLASELSAPTYGYMPNGKIKIESKDEMKKRGLASPNLADAFVLTMSHADRQLVAGAEAYWSQGADDANRVSRFV